MFGTWKRWGMEAKRNKKKQRRKHCVRVPPLETDAPPEMAGIVVVTPQQNQTHTPEIIITI